jgi:hypothetical protein
VVLIETPVERPSFATNCFYILLASQRSIPVEHQKISIDLSQKDRRTSCCIFERITQQLLGR